MAGESFEITVEPGTSRSLVKGTCEYEKHKVMDFYLKRVTHIEERETVFDFEGVRRDLSEWKYSAIVVLKNGTYCPAIFIASGTQGRLGIEDKKVEIAPNACAFLDSIVKKLTPGEETKFN